MSELDSYRFPPDAPQIRLRFYSSGKDLETIKVSGRSKISDDGMGGDVLLVRAGKPRPLEETEIDPESAAIMGPAASIGAGQPDTGGEAGAVSRNAVAGMNVGHKLGIWGVGTAVTELKSNLDYERDRNRDLQAKIDEMGAPNLVALIMSDTGTNNLVKLIGAVGEQIEKVVGGATKVAEGRLSKIIEETVRASVLPLQADIDARLAKVEKK